MNQGERSIAEQIAELFTTRGEDAYFGEAVSQTEHALQAAMFAEESGATASLIIAALLHDVGHLIHNLPEDIADKGHDAHHEELGAAWLRRNFGPEVSEPVRLHVPAKRYLCGTDSEYPDQLSPASVQSLHLQGGPMSPAEIEEFRRNRYWREAARLREWDDRAKVVGLETPGLEHFLQLLH